MKKILLVAALLAFSPISSAVNINDTVDFVRTDGAGNKIYMTKDSSFFFVDGGKSVGQFASISVETIMEENEAGYAIVPAHSLQEMSNNHSFAKTFSVDCDTTMVTDNTTQEKTLKENMNQLNQTASFIACKALESVNKHIKADK